MTFVDDTHLSYTQSLLWAISFALGLVSAAALAVYWAFHHRRSSEAALLRPRVRLREGPITLHGRVRTRDGLPAIKVRIEQSGGERRDKHGRVTMSSWKEVSRKLTVQSFELDVEGGGQVHVEPGASPFLVDDLVERGGTVHARIAQAELSHGERVCIQGVLTQAPGGDYRAIGPSWCLRPPADGPMVLSTAFLSVHHARRARVWRLTGLACIATLVLALFASGSYVPLLLAGAPGEVQVSAHQHGAWCGRHSCPYVLVLRTETGEQVADEVSRVVYERVEDGARLPFVHVPSIPSIHQLGHRATLHAWSPMAMFLLALIPLGVCLGQHVWNIGWFTQKRVTHLQDAGLHR